MAPALRWLWMLAGMTVLALGIRLQVLAGLGLGPWDVLHMGLSLRLPLTFGQANQLVGLAVVAVGWALGERPRLGTLANMVYVGAAYDLIAARLPLPAPASPAAAWAYLAAGIAVMAAGTGWYLSAGLGAGPRDGLTLALARRLASRRPAPAGPGRLRGAPGVGPARGLLEGSAALLGFLLGGPVGPGSVAVVLLMGPAIAAGIARFQFARRWWQPARPAAAAGAVRAWAGPPAGATAAGEVGRR